MLFQKKHKIGDTIAKLRKEKGWTQNELAEMLKVSDKAISKWESNKGDPSIEFLPVMSELFGVTLDYLMTGKEQEEKIVTMSKLELCAKKDNPKIIDNFSYDSAHLKNEDGRTLMYYIDQYNSRNVLTALVDSCCHQTHYMSLFPKKEFDLPQLLKLIEINRERIVLKEIANNADIRSISSFNSDSLWTDRIQLKNISKGYQDIFTYLVKNYDKLDKSQQEYYFDLNPKTILSKKDSWAYAYPYFVDEAYKYNKKLFKKLMEKIENSNQLYISEVDKIKNEGRGESTWIGNQIRYLNEKFYQVFILKETVLTAIECEDYDTANYLNKFTKEKVDEDIFEQAKISKNKKLSEKEKQLLHCIHNGIVNLDELIALNEYDLYEKTLKKYPANEYEVIFKAINDKDYKKIFEYAVQHSITNIIDAIRNKKLDLIEENFCKYIRSKHSPSYGSNKIILSSDINKEYYTIYKRNFGLLNIKGKDNELSYQKFVEMKNKVILSKVLDKDIRFIEKACKNATQEELDAALTKIEPNNFKGIKILLDAGAKLHKTWTEDDGWGYIVNKDEIDEIGTEILKKKINDLLGGK